MNAIDAVKNLWQAQPKVKYTLGEAVEWRDRGGFDVERRVAAVVRRWTPRTIPRAERIGLRVFELVLAAVGWVIGASYSLPPLICLGMGLLLAVLCEVGWRLLVISGRTERVAEIPQRWTRHGMPSELFDAIVAWARADERLRACEADAFELWTLKQVDTSVYRTELDREADEIEQECHQASERVETILADTIFHGGQS